MVGILDRLSFLLLKVALRAVSLDIGVTANRIPCAYIVQYNLETFSPAQVVPVSPLTPAPELWMSCKFRPGALLLLLSFDCSLLLRAQIRLLPLQVVRLVVHIDHADVVSFGYGRHHPVSGYQFHAVIQ